MASPALTVQLDAPLPASLAVGAGSAVFVAGTCFSPEGPTRSLQLVLDDRATPAAAHAMPRLDYFRAHHPAIDPAARPWPSRDPESPADPLLQSYASGFWGIVEVPPAAPGHRFRLALRATVESGSEVEAELATIPLIEPPVPASMPASDSATGPLVAICMATYDPAPEVLGRQLETIRAQTHRNWVCVLSDDCSRPDRYAAIEAAVAGDRRFIVSRSPRRLGFYANFERALGMAPADAGYVAMADQDDSWHPDKLELLLEAIGEAQLVYSDARIVDPTGEVLSNTYWTHRRNNHSDITSLLVANCVTGASSLFRRELLDHALPFPPAQFSHFHDHWVALTALARGDIQFVERPLYDYIQHGGSVIGHAASNRMPTVRARLARLGVEPRERVARWRATFFVDNCRLAQFATILLTRGGPDLSRSKRRALERFLRADRSPLALSWLWLRAARELMGRPETLGAELGLAFGFSWRRLVAATARGSREPRRRLRMDAVPPPSLTPQPGRSESPASAIQAIAEKIAPLRLATRDDAPARVNLLVPTVDLQHFFGGYIAKFNLARRLAEHGVRVRVVTVDPVGALPQKWRRQIESYEGLDGLFDRVEVAFGRESAGLEVSRDDRFIATTWWTAHVAHAAAAAIDRDRFVYLIQEYEPFTFAMGSYAALAEQSYRLPHAAIFSTELLRGYFRRHGIGVYGLGDDAGDSSSVAFQNAITLVEPPTPADLSRRQTRRLLFYARPEAHASRNMFELGVLGLGRAAASGALDGWELHGIGTTAPGRRIGLGSGASLELLPRSGQDRYAQILREHDVGLALMHTPHPSLVPIEMASAGMLAVTNTFENKTAEAMAEISPNLITVEPGVEAIAAGITEAVGGAGDYDRRARGSQVNWSREWNRSFDDELIARLTAFLGD